MSNCAKEKYKKFCESIYVPIYSKPWWMDAICGEEQWDVWLYEKGTEVLAAMPYYKEKRGEYKYITKALLTQNNGLIIKYPSDGAMKLIAKQKYEEEIINNACEYVKSLGIDVYEQQYHYDFKYYLPFFWNEYEIIPRITYVIEDTTSMENVWDNLSSNYRKNIKKGYTNCKIDEGLNKDLFYENHEKVFLRQGLPCPFSRTLWNRLYEACETNNSCKILFAKNDLNEIMSVLFLVWDEKSMYHLLGGTMPGFQKMETYNAITWEGIKLAVERGLKYDFEGSVIKQISKSFREYGGIPKEYFRIRKVFNKEIFERETALKADKLYTKRV